MSDEAVDRYLMPDFPRTQHAPWDPRASRDDLIISERDIEEALSEADSISIEEKVDGASLGVMFHEAQPMARNRNHFLRKSFAAKTPAKQQFSSLWSWMYERRDCFDTLDSLAGESVSVYGEWLVALHTVRYDSLPDKLLAYDIWLPSRHAFIRTDEARDMLIAAGFTVIAQLHRLKSASLLEFKRLLLASRSGRSSYSTLDEREGAYAKLGKRDVMTLRLKCVSESFAPGARWDERQIHKNVIRHDATGRDRR